MVEFLKIADIGESGKAKVKALEESIGAHIMAYEFGYPLAKLSAEQMEEVTALEEELGEGVFLLVYKDNK